MADSRVTLIQVYEAIQTLRTEIASNYAKKETVDSIQKDLTELKKDTKDFQGATTQKLESLDNFKFYFVGVAATVGFAVSLAKDFIIGLFTKGN